MLALVAPALAFVVGYAVESLMPDEYGVDVSNSVREPTLDDLYSQIPLGNAPLTGRNDYRVAAAGFGWDNFAGLYDSGVMPGVQSTGDSGQAFIDRVMSMLNQWKTTGANDPSKNTSNVTTPVTTVRVNPARPNMPGASSDSMIGRVSEVMGLGKGSFKIVTQDGREVGATTDGFTMAQAQVIANNNYQVLKG